MSYILNIETSTSVCSVSLSFNGELKLFREDNSGMKHAVQLSIFIEELLKQEAIGIKQLDAIAVSSGPGSYTGLRIGLSTAKGLCFSNDIPLITIPSLDIIAYGIKHDSEFSIVDGEFIYPMIDARRMEVYTARFDHMLNRVNEYHALIIEDPDFFESLNNAVVFFGGDGAQKFEHYKSEFPNLRFTRVLSSSKYMCILANEKLIKGQFADLAYSEPFYLKDFVAGKPKSQL